METLTVEGSEMLCSHVLCVKCWPNRPDNELWERKAAEGSGLELYFVTYPTEIAFGMHSHGRRPP